MANKQRIAPGRLRYVGEKVCRVRGQDHRGYPKIVLVEAHTLFEAAARGLEEICRQGGQVSELEITIQEPGSQFKVRPQQLAKWLQELRATTERWN